jgi:hypothetical protein
MSADALLSGLTHVHTREEFAKKLASATDGTIRVTHNVPRRLGDQFEFTGPIRFEVEGKDAIEAWQIAV